MHYRAPPEGHKRRPIAANNRSTPYSTQVGGRRALCRSRSPCRPWSSSRRRHINWRKQTSVYRKLDSSDSSGWAGPRDGPRRTPHLSPAPTGPSPCGRQPCHAWRPNYRHGLASLRPHGRTPADRRGEEAAIWRRHVAQTNEARAFHLWRTLIVVRGVAPLLRRSTRFAKRGHRRRSRSRICRRLG